MLRQIEWSSETDAFVGHATLARPPEFFERERGIAFTDSVDGLYHYRGALLLKDDEIKVALKQYRNVNPLWTLVYLSESYREVDEITKLVAEIVAKLGLDERDIVWQRKDSPEA